MSSIYAKLRKQMKDKKEPVMPVQEFVPEAQVEEPALNDEDLTKLLNTLNPTESTSAPDGDPKAGVESVPLAEDKGKKLFDAIGVFYDSGKKKFIQVVVHYDPTTGYTKMAQQDELADNKMVAVSKVLKTIGLRLSKHEEVI